MEQFIVSARKYRPATFDTVVGQGHITTTLKNAIAQQHLAQAFLFCGPRGVGKTTCARILAKTINCQNLTPEVEACDICDSCRSFNGNASFNVHELDAASNNSVDDIRNLVDQVRYPPQAGSKYKIYIIDEVHMLSNAAFNAFLKTLEEPPAYAIFILATTEKHKIIPTILSRCQIFDFNRIDARDISQHLGSIARKEGIRAEEEALQLIAQKADGGLRDALSMFDLIATFSSDRNISYGHTIANLHILDYDYYFKITDALLGENTGQAWIIFDEILKKGFDGHNFIVGLCEHFRNLLVCKDTATVQLLQVSGNVRQKYLQQAAQTPVSFLASAMNLASTCDQQYKASKNPKLLVELSLMKMAHLPAAVQLARQLQENGGELKKKVEPGVEGTQPAPSVNGNGNGAAKSTNGTREPAGIPNGTPAKATPSIKATPTISLNAQPAGAVNHASSGNTPAPVVVAPVKPIGEDGYTPEQLRTQWETFSRTRQAPTDQLILSREYKLEGHTILLTLDNQIQVNQLEGFKSELLDFLRRSLNNRSVQVRAEVGQIETKRMVYTNQEKFRYLLQKHPILIELKNQWGLEIE